MPERSQLSLYLGVCLDIRKLYVFQSRAKEGSQLVRDDDERATYTLYCGIEKNY